MATLPPHESPASTDWQSSKATVRERTTFLFNNSLKSDVTFVVKDSADDTTVRVPAHKFVLTISSPAFDRMFSGMFAEEEEIKLTDTDYETLLEFLRFIYCDDIQLTTQNVLDVFYIAKKYIVSALVTKCTAFLMEKTNPENACQVLEVAKTFEESALEQRCWEIIDQHTSACLQSDRVLTLRHDSLVALLERDTLRAKEIDLFEASKRWAEARCEEKGLEKTGSVLKEMLGEAVELMRFPVMSQKQFARYVVPTGILTSEKALQVYQFFSEVITEDDVGFSSTQRKAVGFIPSFECIRFTDTTSGSWHSEERFGKVTETLTFETDHDILFRGVRLENRFEEGQFKATLRLSSEKRRTPWKVTESTVIWQRYNSGGIDIKFDYPVTIDSSSNYVIQTSLEALGGTPKLHKYERDELPEVCSDSGVEFKFQNSSGTSNQISRLFFHKKNAL